MQSKQDLEIEPSFQQLYVMLDRVDVHCIWVSEKVLSLLPKDIGHIPGGEIPAKGVFCDNAMDVVLQHYPKPGRERKTKFVKDAMQELDKFGIVGMHDAGVTPTDCESQCYDRMRNQEHLLSGCSQKGFYLEREVSCSKRQAFWR
jgi:predicted amidohydrolase YtcJ